MRLPEHPQSVASGSATECESSCLKNCSCTAYAYDRNGCSIWTMHLVNLQQLLGNDSSGSSLYLRLAASEFSRDNNMGIIIGVVGSVVVLGFVYVMWKQQRRLIATPCLQFMVHWLHLDTKICKKQPKISRRKWGAEVLVLFSKGHCLIPLS
ncbi:hypothetical protein CsSME_00019499 [Camellia sinensis var. sinensis]